MSLGRTAYSVTLPLNSLGGIENIESIEMRRREYHHEMCIVRARNQPSLGLRSGDPITVTASGAAGGSEKFVGYIDHVRDHQAVDTKHRHTDLVCVGPTWHMQQPRQRVWKNMTISAIARKICSDYQLTIDCEDATLARTHNQASESDWAFLVRLAKMYGYVMWPTLTVVHFQTRTRGLDAKNKAAPQLQFEPPALGITSDVYEFKTIVGDSPQTGGKAQRLMQTVDASTSQVVSNKDDGAPTVATRQSSTAGLFDEYMTDSIAVSATDLAAQIKGAQEHHLWVYKAKAETRGIAGIQPTSVIYFINVDNQWDGYWTVLGVHHTFTQNFQDVMHLELGTNSLGAPVSNYTPGTVPIAINASQSVPTPSASLSAPTVLLPQTDGRGTKANPLKWRGSPANLDASAPEPPTSSRATKRLRANA